MAGELILIIEDNQRNLKLVRDLLNHAGYQTIEASTAEKGLALAQTRLPALILMDIQLPGIDGITALGRLQADAAMARIPVIALTAFAMKDDQARFLHAGFDGYLAKPISVRELPQQVSQFLRAARERSSDA